MAQSGKMAEMSVRRIAARRRLSRPQRLIFLFLGAFAVLFAIHWTIFHILTVRYRDAVDQLPDAKLADAARTAVPWLSEPAAYSDSAKSSEILWRICESSGIERAFIANVERTIIANSWRGSQPDAATEFSMTPSIFLETLQTGAPGYEQVAYVGVNYRRLYQPLTDGRSRRVLCFEIYDGSHTDIEALAGLLTIGRIIGLISSLALAGLFIYLLWNMERTQRNLLRVDHLATAGELSAAIAHEVKNPLAIILSTTGLLETQGDQPDKRARWLDTIRRSVKTAEGHIETFLDLARDTPLRLAHDDLRDVIRATVELVDSRVAQLGATLTLELPKEPIDALIDRRKISQALVNLIFNALDATGANGQIRVSATVDGSDALIIVADNGAGISPDDMKNLFEPFFTTKPNGTGLGLLSAKKAAERHGGTLTLASKLHHGVTATLRLPLRRPESGA